MAADQLVKGQVFSSNQNLPSLHRTPPFGRGTSFSDIKSQQKHGGCQIQTSPAAYSEFQIFAVLPKDMTDITAEGQIQLVAGMEGVDMRAAGVHGRHNHHHVFAFGIGMEMDLAAHHFEIGRAHV